MHALLPSRRANGRRQLTASMAMALAAALAVGGLAPVAAADPLLTTTTLEASAATLQEHHPLTLTATVTPVAAPDPAPPIVGTVMFKDVYNGGDGQDFGPVDVVNGQATFQFSSLRVGQHVFTAEFTNGDGAYEDSNSKLEPVQVTVTVDVIEATGVGVGLATFYPKVDGYKDTLPVKGKRGEPLTVAITIRNSAGKIVRSASLAKAAGAYTWSWNGKNKAGTLQPAGTYTVRQVLRDGYGTMTVTKSVKLSWKKLAWRTYTKTKSLAGSAWTTGGAAGWAFTVPAAAVYGKLTASVYAKGSGGITVRDARCVGSTWDPSPCWVAAYKSFDSNVWAWRKMARASGAKFVSSSHVIRVVVEANGLLWVRKVDTVRLTLRYAVLR